MKVSLTQDAEDELIDSARYYASEANAELGREFISEFERSLALLQEHPKFGAVWRDVTRRPPLRRFPYSIVYVLLDDEIRVLAVAHQNRRPGFWKGRV